MTNKSHALAELPLLGSNQDSPDPESVEFGQFALDFRNAPARIAPEIGHLTHENPHGLSHRDFVAAVWGAVLSAADGRCAYCGEVSEKLVREHMVPTRLGGGDEIENIVAACPACNARKGPRTPLVWFLLRDDIAAGRFKARRPYRRATPCQWCRDNLFKAYIDTSDLELRVLERCITCIAIRQGAGRRLSLGAGQ